MIVEVTVLRRYGKAVPDLDFTRVRPRGSENESGRATWSYGSAVPDLLLTNEMSALLRNPSAFTSSRKLEPPTS